MPSLVSTILLRLISSLNHFSKLISTLFRSLFQPFDSRSFLMSTFFFRNLFQPFCRSLFQPFCRNLFLISTIFFQAYFLSQPFCRNLFEPFCRSLFTISTILSKLISTILLKLGQDVSQSLALPYQGTLKRTATIYKSVPIGKNRVH